MFILGTLKAQYKTNVSVSDLNNSVLQNKIETTLSSLLTMFNTACINKTALDLSRFNIDDNARKSIEMLWKNSPFRCEETDIVEPCLKLYTGNEYEVRNIPLIFAKLDNEYHEVAITFDMNARITSFHITLEQNLYENVFSNQNEITDLRRRQIILDYVEQFRTAYNTKDIDFMNKVFSNDALIIVGRNVIVKKENMPATTRTEFFKKNKEQYLNDLRKVFKGNKRIHVDFQDVKIKMHPAKKDWYGVQLKQGFTSDRYHDDGYLFLLWDFTAGDDKPQIHVRTWQPDEDGFGRKISEDEVFGLDDVNIY